MRLYQHLHTTHDRNGNPRRLWVFYEAQIGNEQADVVLIVDEGYSGTPAEVLGATELEDAEITTGEYREVIAFARAERILRHG